jgi:hypothetical protein
VGGRFTTIDYPGAAPPTVCGHSAPDEVIGASTSNQNDP